MRKEQAVIDFWSKATAPSDALRRWYGHDPRKWPTFIERYVAELDKNWEGVVTLEKIIAKAPVTFIYAAADEERNSAVALKEYLYRRF